jgi:hypothetical protein
MVSAALAAGLQSVSQSEKPALWIGCVVLLITVAMLGGMVSVAKKLKRGEGNRKCLLSYVCFAAGWTLYLAIAAITYQAGASTLGTIVALLVFAGFGLAGVSLAIVGLGELRHSADLLKEGRSTAILTLSLSTVVLLGLGAAFGFGVLQGLRGRVKSLAPPGATAVFEDHRFSIKPHAPWVRVETAPINPLAAAAFQRQRPEGIVIVIAERIPAGVGLDYEVMTGSVRENLGRASSRFKVVDEAPETINGLAGYRMVCEANVQGSPFTYLYWLHLTTEFAYQLIAMTSAPDASTILPEARKAFSTFTLLPPK